MFDLSFVPSVGAKKATSIVHFADMTEVVKTQVVDTAPVQMSVGLNAENGSWTLGASWDLGFGSHNRLDNALTFKARYAF